MGAIEAGTFSGYGGLRKVELPKPRPARNRVLVRVTAAGVTPLDYTILSGGHPRAKALLVLGNEGGGSGFASVRGPARNACFWSESSQTTMSERLIRRDGAHKGHAFGPERL